MADQEKPATDVAAHPVDEIVKAYHAKLTELGALNVDLAKLQPLLEKKAKIEAEIADLRIKLTE